MEPFPLAFQHDDWSQPGPSRKWVQVSNRFCWSYRNSVIPSLEIHAYCSVINAAERSRLKTTISCCICNRWRRS